MQDDSYWFNFILLHMDISVSQHCLLKFFSLACVSGIFVTEMADVMCTHIWVFDYCSNGQHVCSCASSIFGFGGLFLFPPPLFFLDWVYLCSHGSPGTLCVGQADLGFTNTGTKMCATMYSSCYFYYSGSVIYFRIWNGDSLPSIFLFAQIVLAV